MAIRKILTVGHPTLTKKAEPCAGIDEELKALARDMIETLHAAPGVGLAAPQVDVSRRLIVIDISVGENPDDIIVLANPEIVHSEGSDVAEEGCLSVPDIREKVTRPAKVVVRGLDLEGAERTYEAAEFLARAFCHEIDHLDGRLFIDYLSPLKKTLIRKKLRKAAESPKL